MKKEKKNGDIHLLNCSILSGSTQHIKPQFSRETTESVRQPVAFRESTSSSLSSGYKLTACAPAGRENGTYSTSCRLLWVHHQVAHRPHHCTSPSVYCRLQSNTGFCLYHYTESFLRLGTILRPFK